MHLPRSLAPLALALCLAGCGAPGPLDADPNYDPSFGPSVQYHAGQSNGNFVMDGLAQGVASLDATLVRNGQTVTTRHVSLDPAGRFTLTLGPVQAGDQVILAGPGYRTVMTMTWLGGVS